MSKKQSIVTRSLAYSPCPNDTFMFCDLAAGNVPGLDIKFDIHLHDVETLNTFALEARYDITKMSFHTWLLVKSRYELLNTGAALGSGCGPLLVAKKPVALADLPRCRVALPGELTTAHMLLRLMAPGIMDKIFVPYDKVLDLVVEGKADCGVIIHESRFVYPGKGLVCVADLGEWWEKKTGQPIPLGCIAVRKTLGVETVKRVEDILRECIRHSLANPAGTTEYVSRNARETNIEVINEHIRMFVNEFSVDLGDRGRKAVSVLEEMARNAGVIP